MLIAIPVLYRWGYFWFYPTKASQYIGYTLAAITCLAPTVLIPLWMSHVKKQKYKIWQITKIRFFAAIVIAAFLSLPIGHLYGTIVAGWIVELTGKEVQKAYIVRRGVETDQPFRRRCWHRVSFWNLDGTPQKGFCVSSSDLQQFRAGETIIAVGHESFLGFRIERFITQRFGRES